MQTIIENVAKVIYETWGGAWEACPEGRKAQAREEAIKAIEESGLPKMQAALKQIAFMRPAGATPKMVSGALVEKMEKIALSVIAN